MPRRSWVRWVLKKRINPKTAAPARNPTVKPAGTSREPSPSNAHAPPRQRARYSESLRAHRNTRRSTLSELHSDPVGRGVVVEDIVESTTVDGLVWLINHLDSEGKFLHGCDRTRLVRDVRAPRC